MSRIGKMPIPVPAGVTVLFDGLQVTVKGPKGQLMQTFHPNIEIVLEDNTLFVQRPNDERQNRALHVMTRALL